LKPHPADPHAQALDIDQFKLDYERILKDFVDTGTEEQLLRASDLGRLALDSDIGLLDIAGIHINTVNEIIKSNAALDPVEVTDKAGSILLDSISAFDISARGFLDMLEDARQKSEEDVKAIFASAQDGVLLFNEARTIIDCNQAFANMLGFTREELVEQSRVVGRSGPFGGIQEAAVEQLGEKGYFDEFERTFMKKDGSSVLVTISGAMIGGRHEGPAWHAFAFVKDITERKRAEEAISRSEEKFRNLYESSIDGIVSLDMDGRITDANKAYLDMLGFSLDEARRLTYLQITPEKWHEMERDLIETQVNVHGYSPLYEKEYRRKDGTVFPVSVRRWLIRDEQGNPGGVWSIVRDITDNKRVEEELERINAELEGYARSVSHDLRGPLSSIALAAHALRDVIVESDPEVLREEVREAEKTIRRSVIRSYALIDDLLALAESGLAPTSPSDVDVASVVSTIREENANEIEMRRVAFETSEDLGVVRASPTQMYQLFSNLIMNAVTHNDSAQPVVKVSYHGRSSEGAHLYSVCDNGRGIPVEDSENIFKPFFKRGRSSRTGVGLAIVDKVTAVYGGSIRAYNDSGACFEFSLNDWNPPGEEE